MALIIRMRQQGTNGEQKFRFVVTDKRHPRDGQYIEKLGWYNPCDKGDQNYFIDIDRVQFWLDHGAEISDRVKSFVKRKAPEVIQNLTQKKVAKVAKRRNARK